MIKTAFRPSDDASTFSFLIPSNAMAAVYLNKTADMILSIKKIVDDDDKNFFN